jgi:hypothetical protein
MMLIYDVTRASFLDLELSFPRRMPAGKATENEAQFRQNLGKGMRLLRDGSK